MWPWGDCRTRALQSCSAAVTLCCGTLCCPVLSGLPFVRDETSEVTYMEYRGRQIKGALLSTVCWGRGPSSLLCRCNETRTQTNVGRKGLLLSCPSCVLSFFCLVLHQGKPSQETGTEAETTEEWFLLACSFWLAQSLIAQARLPRKAATHSGLDPSTSTRNFIKYPSDVLKY